RPATGIDEDGNPACPAHRVEQASRPKNQPQSRLFQNHPQTNNLMVRAASSRQGDQMETTKKGKRICKVSECLAELGTANESGYCAIHRHLGDPRRRTSLARVLSKTVTTAARKIETAVQAKNGAAKLARSSNGQRLDQFLTMLPTTDKMRIVDAWFGGRI